MYFSSTSFILGFLPCLILCYFIVPQGKDNRFLWIKNLILLIFSLAFYAWGGVSYLFLLLASVMINYLGGLFVTVPKVKNAQKLILFLTVFANLALLGWFKYANFAAELLIYFGADISVPNVVLPIGISFFTFQGMSYVIDVYRRDASVQKNPLKVALYVSLFPQLVAGPIVRYTTVENALNARTHTLNTFADGAVRFMTGFGKKMILANAMAEIADSIFAMDISCSLTPTLAWIGAISYTFQIYFDFSAYSDMAIGLGKIFGFEFNENFNYPYIATSVTDFWRRWHISLSSWFRDYVYIPLGGNRCSVLRHIFNLLVVWTLTGLWHGANLTFILWGLYFGVILIAEKYLLGGILPKIPMVLRRILTFFAVIQTWKLFRSDSVPAAMSYLAVMFGRYGGTGFSQYAMYYIHQYYPEIILSFIAIFPIKNVLSRFVERHSDSTAIYALGQFLPKVFAVSVFILGYLKLVSGSFNPFIYFQF